MRVDDGEEDDDAFSFSSSPFSSFPSSSSASPLISNAFFNTSNTPLIASSFASSSNDRSWMNGNPKRRISVHRGCRKSVEGREQEGRLERKGDERRK